MSKQLKKARKQSEQAELESMLGSDEDLQLTSKHKLGIVRDKAKRRIRIEKER